MRVTPEKGSEPRILEISNKCIAMLKALPMDQSKTFSRSLRHFRRSFRRQRKRVANKLKNSRVELIHFHTLRHYFATMDYHHNKDILRTMKRLGHHNIQSTLIYAQLAKIEKTDEFYSATAKATEEAKQLVEDGFEYVCTTPEELMLFRKRK